MRRLTLGIALTMAVLGCDSSEFDGCSDAALEPGANVERCPRSIFGVRKDGERAFEVAGVVRRGENPVAGAVVHIAPSSPALPGAAVTTSTNEAGLFGLIPAVALRYDLITRMDRDVIAMHNLAYRNVQPTLEVDSAGPPRFDRAFRVPVEVRLLRPVAPGRAIALFADGEHTLGVTGNVTDGVSILLDEYASAFKLHVVVYEAGSDLASATDYGAFEGFGTANDKIFAQVPLDALLPANYGEVTVQPVLPEGFTVTSITARVGYSRTSYAPLTTLEPGVKKRVAALPFAQYSSYRVVARRADGASITSGEIGFDLFARTPQKPELDVSIPAGLGPAILAPGDELAGDGKGVLEHVFEGEGRSLRVITTAGAFRLPDLTRLGLPAPFGPYTWRVRSYEDVPFAEYLGGIEPRRYRTVGISPARSIVFR